MIIINNINKHFENNSIIFIDSRLVYTKRIIVDDLVFNIDKNNNVKSINVLNNLKYNIKNDKFYTTKLSELVAINKIALENNLIINDKPQFVYVKVIKRVVHPKSEKLFVLTVSDSKNEFQIVTNTLDSLEGCVLVCALPGSTTYSGSNVLPGKVMDVESNGMLAGYQTLSINKQGLIFGDIEDIGKEFIIKHDN